MSNQWAGITPDERFWPKVRKFDGCWEWVGSHDGRSGHAAKTQCPKGHPYNAANTKIYHGTRSCRTCAIDANRRYRAKRRGFLVSDEADLAAGWT